MIELELTLLSANPHPSLQVIKVLEAFEAQYRTRVNVRNIPWSQAKSELLNYALLKDTPDVSDLGSTWLGGFIAMNALRPFGATEIAAIGEGNFLPVVWNSGKTSSGNMYAIPWIVDSRGIYYRKDHFEQAGIDVATAFQSIDDLKSAWKKLQDYGYPIPWAFLSSAHSLTVLHYLASWVWYNGGTFINEAGTQPLFHSDLAREGMYRYFTEQFPYLSEAARYMDDDTLNSTFRQGNASMIYSGFWILDAINRLGAASSVKKNLGVATLPMPSYVGGNSLVIWKNSRHPKEAIQLIQYLTSFDVQVKLERNFTYLPARTEALEKTLLADYPDCQSVFMRSLRQGRTFSAPYMWGMVESRLLQVVIGLWQEMFKNPRVDIEKLIDQRMNRLANRLALTLSSR